MSRRIAALAVLVVVAASSLTGCGGTAVTQPEPVERVLVFTMPGVTWAEVQRHDLPVLRELLASSAIGDASTRLGQFRTNTTAAYLTMGSGTRAVVPGVDTGVALNPDELHGGIPASELLARRLGRVLDGIAYIPVGATIDANATSPFAAEPGLLGDLLADAGVHRAVIANADAAEGFPTDEPPPDGAYARGAATALMGSDGFVPGGSVGRNLLLEDPEAPFGRRLDPDQVLDTFTQEWEQPGRVVALVEASDLSRASAYASRAAPMQQRQLRTDALEDADELLGRLLDEVDPERDAVLVLNPVSASHLGIAALRTPEIDGGLLRSASTRRAGYVYLADVAPTVLELVGEEPPTSVEGRPFDVAAADGDRIDLLARQAADARTRDARLPVVVPVVIALLVVLTAAVVARDRLGDRVRPLLQPAAFAALGIVPGTFLAGQVASTRESGLAYVAAIALVAVLVAAVAVLVERRWQGTGALVALGSILVAVGVDLLVGAPLQVNTVFGYSMAVAGRFTGLGNLAFALFASAAVCFAVLAHDRFGERALPWLAGVLLAIVLLVGLPMLGADVGGILSVVPAFTLTLLALLGRRLGWRTLGVGVLAGFVVVGLFGLLDSSQDAGSKTHLARMGEHLADGRLGSVATVLWRRINATFGDDQTMIWLLGLALVGLALVQAVLRARRAGPVLGDRGPGGDALLWGLAVLATVGLVANDSSIAVPATMLIVIVPVLVLRELHGTTASNEPEAAR